MAAKIKFPSINQIYKQPNFAKIISASLKVFPNKGSYNKIYRLPNYIRLSETNLSNQPGIDVGIYTYQGGFIPETGNLFYDDLYGENTSYTFNITNFIKNQSDNFGENNSALLLLPLPNIFNTTLERVVLNDGTKKQNPLKLEIYYAVIQ